MANIGTVMKVTSFLCTAKKLRKQKYIKAIIANIVPPVAALHPVSTIIPRNVLSNIARIIMRNIHRVLEIFAEIAEDMRYTEPIELAIKKYAVLFEFDVGPR
jgi:hypothetical protein